MTENARCFAEFFLTSTEGLNLTSMGFFWLRPSLESGDPRGLSGMTIAFCNELQRQEIHSTKPNRKRDRNLIF
jgi:hypothetical protein